MVLSGYGESPDGQFASTTTAVLSADSIMENYQWDLETHITCTAAEPVELAGVEYNNVYPARTGRCMLFAPYKEYNCTLLTDKDGMVWRCPHQHSMHYGYKMPQLHFAAGSIGGFFGEPAPKGCPVVVVKESTLEPFWGICDMFYDLHCQALVDGPVQPGASWLFKYQVKYLHQLESDHLLTQSRPFTVTEEDWRRFDYPRLELGMNDFATGVYIDRPDDASCFRPRPPKQVWDREVGHRAKGSLRLTNSMPEENAWGMEPPSQIPSETRLNITAMVKTEGVEGKGAFLRVRYHTYVWHPTPHVEYPITLESVPVNGTTDGWVKVTVPELTVPEEQFDYLIGFEVVLDGKGVAWVTDVDIDLQYATPELPVAQEGGLSKAVKAASRARAGAAPL